ncbi:MAG: hypothetical protein COS99_02445, partial [Candidatus Omnitrophica bacterium CG07_land_8_20_14_0_80_42_15]
MKKNHNTQIINNIQMTDKIYMRSILKNKFLSNFTAIIVIFTFLFSSIFQGITFADETPVSESAVYANRGTQNEANYALAPAAPLGAVSTAAAGTAFPSLSTASAVSSFQVDPSSGMGVTSIPIAAPAGRQGMAPAIGITYSSVAKNGLLGVGWSLNLGCIERSTKNGPPKYDNTDTFIVNMGGGQEELVPVGSGEYRVKIENSFTRFEFDGATWKATDKTGRKYYFGLQTYDFIKSGSKIFAWGLSKIVDTKGNYLAITYFGSNDLRPSLITYTGNKNTSLQTIHKIQFLYEVRQDLSNSYRSGFSVAANYRLSQIDILTSDALIRRYKFNYTYHQKTSRSLLQEVVIYGKNASTSLPPIAFKYHDTEKFEYDFFNTGLDLTKPGDNLWSARFSGGFDRGHDNFGPIPPPCFDIEWGSIYTQSSGSWGSGNWNTGSSGNLGFWSSKDCANWFWTFVYVDSDKTINVPWTSGGVIGVYINGDYYNDSGHTWKLKKGINLIEITAYHQHENFAFSLNTELVNQVIIMNSSQIVIPQLAGDYNGDGLTDLGALVAEDGTWKIALSNGSAVLPESVWITGFGKNCVPILGDFNSDGKADIAGFDKTAGTWRVALSTGNGFIDNGVWISGFGSGKDSITGDFNGDGRIDIGFYDSTAGSWCVALSDGKKFVNKGIWRSGFSVGKPYAADFNGDGLTDICLFNETDLSWRICLSRGNCFEAPAAWITGFGVAGKIFIADINGDGLSDIGYVDTVYSRVMAAYSRGDKFAQPIEWLEEMALTEDDVMFQMVDFNGDGISDPFLFSPSLQKSAWGLSKSGASELLYEIDNGMGAILKISYSPSTRYGNKTDTGESGLPFPIQTVSETMLSDSMGNDYHTYYFYSGGLFDTTEREFRGFKCTTVVDDEGNQAETYMLQDDIFKGKPFLSQIKDIEGNVLAKTETIWKSKEIYPGVTFVYLTEQNTFTYDGEEKQTRSRFEYDDYGNPTKVISEGDVSISGDEKTQVTEYLYNRTDWIMSLPQHAYMLDESGSVVSEKWFYYDGGSLGSVPTKGLLTKEETEIYNPITLVRTRAAAQYSYDAYGNLISATDPLNRISTVEYETVSYTYPRKTTNAMGHSVYSEYDLGTGAVIKTTDPNNITSINTYDDLGRLTETKQEYKVGSVINSVSRTLCEYDFTSIPLRITQKQRISQGDPSNYLTVYSFYDGLGRLVQTKSPAEGYLKQVASDTVKFDCKGRVKEKYFPCFVNVPNEESKSKFSPPDYTQPKAVFFYDSLGRAVSISNPDGTSSGVEYSGWTIIKTDENGHQKKEYRNAYGNIVEIEEYNDGQTYTTHYEYDALGNLVKLIDDKGNTTAITYDSAGRKIKMDDPDMGVWAYEYDAVGNLMKQTDAKGQTIEFKYDALNRLIEKRIP